MQGRRKFIIVFIIILFALIFGIFYFTSTSSTPKVDNNPVQVKAENNSLSEEKKVEEVETVHFGSSVLEKENSKVYEESFYENKSLTLKFEEMTEKEMISTFIDHELGHERISEILELIDEKPELLNSPVKDGKYLIHLAVQAANSDLVSELIERGDDVNVAEDSTNQTPLHLAACIFNDKKILKMLIKAGAKIDAIDINGETALAHAVICENYYAAKVLLKNGADPNLYIIPPSAEEDLTSSDPKNVKTIINIAASLDDNQMVALLLDHDANPELTDCLMFNALHTAAYYGHTYTVEELLETDEIGVNLKCSKCRESDSQNDQFKGLTALDLALQRGHKETSDLLKRYRAKRSKPKK